MTTRNRALKNVLFNWAGLVTNLAIAFFLAPFIVHKLGNVYYGVWVLMMQFTGYLGLLESGVRESVIKYVAKHHAEGDTKTLNSLVSAAISMYALLGVLALLTAGGVAAVFPHVFNVPSYAVFDARMIALITGLNVAQGFVFNTFPGILMGLQRFDIFSKISIVFAFIRALLIVVFLNLGEGIIALGLIQLGLSVVSNLLIYWRCKKEIPALRIRIPQRGLQNYRRVFTYSFFVFVNNLSQKIVFYTNAFVIGAFVSASAITFYAIAGNLIEYLRQFIRAMARVFNPMVSELEAKRDEGSIKEVLLRGTRFSLLLGLPVCTVYLLMGRRFISLWMGPEYAEKSGEVLLILTITHLLSLPHYTIGNVLYGLSRHHIIAGCRFVEAMANLGLSIVLVRRLGIMGVALGTALTHVVMVVILLPPLTCRIVGLPLWELVKSSYLRPFAAAVPFAAGCYWMNSAYPATSLAAFFLQIFVVLPVYFLPVWLVALSPEDREHARGIVRGFLPRSGRNGA